MAVRIQFRRGTASDWSSTNPILANGEVGYETDTKKFKVGNGTLRWNDPDLPYYGNGTITEVIAGTGLQGGGNSGSVTLSVDGTVITTSYVTAKGDLITAAADNDTRILSVGTTDGDVLQVSSSATTGLAYGKVQTSAIANDAVTTDKIYAASVTEAKLATDSVSTAKIVDNAVTAGKLASNSVTGTKIAVNAVTETKIADGSISTDKIAQYAVTADKFADGIITTAKIANNTILNEDINSAAGISFSKLQTGTLPSDIKVGTDNYVDNSITVAKLSNTVGADGVGVWQDWTPTVTSNFGLTSNQWEIVYCKYMRINNMCISYGIIKLKNITSASRVRYIKMTLPVAPIFDTVLPAGTTVAMGNFVSSSAQHDPTSYYSVYRTGSPNGYLEHWRHNDIDYIIDSYAGDYISFNAYYPVA